MVSIMPFSKKRRISVNIENIVLTNMQDSIFAQPRAARQGIINRCTVMTKRQDSRFAQPQAARQGSVQGCSL